MQKYKIEELCDIPLSEIDEVVLDYESEGAKVERIPQPDGNWTARAIFFENTAVA